MLAQIWGRTRGLSARVGLGGLDVVVAASRESRESEKRWHRSRVLPLCGCVTIVAWALPRGLGRRVSRCGTVGGCHRRRSLPRRRYPLRSVRRRPRSASYHRRPSPSPISSDNTDGHTQHGIAVDIFRHDEMVSFLRWCCRRRMAWAAERLLHYTLRTHIAIFLLRLSSQTMFISIRKWLVLAACLTGQFCVHGNERGGVGSGIRGGTDAASAGSNSGEVRIMRISRLLLCCVKPLKSSLLAVSSHQAGRGR